MDIARLDRRGGAVFRGENLGFIFERLQPDPVLSVYENIEYPLLMVQTSRLGKGPGGLPFYWKRSG